MTAEERSGSIFDLDICIATLNGKYGIMKKSDETFIVPLEYDNIFQCRELFILVKNGKQGLCEIETTSDESEYFVNIITPCEYNTIYHSGYYTITLDGLDGSRYYNLDTKKLSELYPCISSCYDIRGFQNRRHIQTHHKNMCYLIDTKTDEIIYCAEFSEDSGYAFDDVGTANGKSVFRVGGITNGLLCYGENGYTLIPGYTISSITNENYKNIINIAKTANGFGLIGNSGNFLTDVCYDTIRADIKLTAEHNGESVEITVPYDEYKKSDYLDYVSLD